MSKLLIDTNIFIYALDKDSIHHQKSVEYLTSKDKLFTTSKNISEYFAVTSKIGIETAITIGFYGEIKQNLVVLYPNDKSLLIFEKLYKKYAPKGNRVFDLEIVSIMLANKIHKIATLNQKDFITIDEVQLAE